MNESDVLIIGSGVAGCSAALTAADAGLNVTLLTNAAKAEKGSNTSWAQGGIIHTGPEDSPDLLVKDVLAAGDSVVWEPAARILAEEGPRRVAEILIERCRIPFDKQASGELDLTEEGAHSVPRIIHVGDHTGQAIAEGLAAEVARTPGITVIPNVTAVDLILNSYHTDDPTDVYRPVRCLGAYVLDQKTGEVKPFVARETILATGGLGQIYLHTTNPKRSRGDGLAMAYRAGARVINLEYVQFHPTAFYHRMAPRFLISESLRGEGARLINADGQEFAHKYHELGALASRDVVARAIHEEMLQTGEPCMFLDITHKNAEWVRSRFPLIHEFLLGWDIDITKEPIPVTPAAHYSCGGVAVDENGRTSINGLRAVGEVSCTGLHGANRLASTSLLEGLVWGTRAAHDIVKTAGAIRLANQASITPWKMETEEVDPALIKQDWMTIKQTMWNYVGLVRSNRRMHRALRILRGLQFDVETFYRRAALTDDMIGLRNGAQTALALIHAALRNRTSRGSHYRVD
ncbi:MAG: L-aspartate oxidase [Candidatus Sumerlaeota bacterium]|nr:L-aspartate oxidase [Candidatus Sumerlaeota bacterium]